MKLRSVFFNKDIFFLKHRSKWILFAPWPGKVIPITNKEKLLLESVYQSRILLDSKDNKFAKVLLRENIISFKPFKDKKVVYKRVTANLNLTSMCNMKCIYCFAEANKVKKTVSWEMVKLFLEERSRLLKPGYMFAVEYVGGGEQTLHWDLFKKSVLYARKLAIQRKARPYLSISTNGLLTEEKCDFIRKHFQSIQLSMDGLSDVQNSQRPTVAGGKTFDVVSKSLLWLNKGNSLNVRATYTDESVAKMPSFLKFLEDSGIKKAQFESVHKSGRAKSATRGASLILARKLNSSKIILKPKSNLKQRLVYYCGALCEGCGLTPEGYITRCPEVTLKSNPFSKVFFIGKLNMQKKRIDYFNGRIKYLADRRIENLPGCKDCFAKYNCAGSCPTRILKLTNDIYATKKNSLRCKEIRHDLKKQIVSLV